MLCAGTSSLIVAASGGVRPSWAPAGTVAAYDAISGYGWRTSLTVTRASGGWLFGPSSGLLFFPAEAPRLAHDLGLCVEGAAVNCLPNSRLLGAVIGTPGTLPTGWRKVVSAGLSMEVVGLPIVRGAPAIDLRVYGALGSGGNNYAAVLLNDHPEIPAEPGQTWTVQCRTLLLAVLGTPSISSAYIYVQPRTASLSGLSSLNAPVTLTNAESLLKATGTTQSTTAYVQGGLVINYNAAPAGTAVDMTFRMFLPQLEQSAVASSPILTSGGAGARNSETVDLRMADGVYTVIVRDRFRGLTTNRTGQSAAGGVLRITPPVGSTFITSVEVYS